jgi:hypothetical protein
MLGIVSELLDENSQYLLPTANSQQLITNL